MIYLITATTLIFGYAVAQDANCDFRQNVAATERYYIYNPGWPRNYPAGRTCRYIAVCPDGYNCRADFRINMPSSPGCSGDRILVSLSGDPTLAGATAYCGVSTFSVLSLSQELSIGFISTSTSRGGTFAVNLTAQRVPTTTPPPTIGCSCGIRKNTRIVGGTETGKNEYPMMAALIEISINSIHCGATIIGHSHSITAAHCVYSYRNTPTRLILSVGDHNITNRNPNNAYEIQRFIIHENYNPTTYNYDISLVVTRYIQFNDKVSPVCLPFKYTNTNVAGSKVTLLGWGTLEPGGMLPDTLQEVAVTRISQSECARTETVTDTQFCTFTRGKDACQFDSGGPALYTDGSNGFLYILGAISNGASCGSNRPGIITDVVALLRWIVNRSLNESFCIKQ